MRTFDIALIPGDGIGHDVIEQGVRVLNRLAELDGGLQFNYTSYPYSCRYYLEHGKMMDDDALDRLSQHHAIYLGACGFPGVPDHVSLWGMLLPIRKTFDVWVNLRPVRLLPGVTGPLAGRGPEDINFVIVRENTEGEYAGVGGRVHPGTPHETAMQTAVFTRTGTERIIRYAFEYARKHGFGSVQSATKSNACQYSMVFWDEVFDAVRSEYPDIEASQYHVDALSARFVTHPHTLGVVVGSNLFGDILSDLGGALMGSLGLPPSASINPAGGVPGIFEPVHGSAPDIAGKGIANPIAAIWSAAMMLEDLGVPDGAAALMAAIEGVTASGAARTPDLGGTATTSEVGDAIIAALEAHCGA
ncbi:MAG TPA: tartrate dehydrogenase [Thermomicrobiales bacterium]|nr:tartrate dehydrogenase [Thermomicrobiales bacterium]